jgi:16S rRNA (cytidine1402-2'-O)-methyltransferase
VSGTLFVVATPIGHLEDITLRALRVLKEADRVLAEDTRHTRKLLSHYGISSPLASLHAHTAPERIAALAEELAGGLGFALVTDAGTPLVSDPGRALVTAAIARGVRVEAIPGASAVLTALCASGIACDRFRFVGFLPRSGRKRREALQAIAHDTSATVLFESPNRIRETLAELGALCGAERQAALCRELTKLHEEVSRGSFAELQAQLSAAPRGEMTLVVEAAPADQVSDSSEPAEEEIAALLQAQSDAGTGARDAARELVTRWGMNRRDAYRRVVEHRKQSG